MWNIDDNKMLLNSYNVDDSTLYEMLKYISSHEHDESSQLYNQYLQHNNVYVVVLANEIYTELNSSFIEFIKQPKFFVWEGIFKPYTRGSNKNPKSKAYVDDMFKYNNNPNVVVIKKYLYSAHTITCRGCDGYVTYVAFADKNLFNQYLRPCLIQYFKQYNISANQIYYNLQHAANAVDIKLPQSTLLDISGIKAKYDLSDEDLDELFDSYSYEHGNIVCESNTQIQQISHRLEEYFNRLAYSGSDNVCINIVDDEFKIIELDDLEDGVKFFLNCIEEDCIDNTNNYTYEVSFKPYFKAYFKYDDGFNNESHYYFIIKTPKSANGVFNYIAQHLSLKNVAALDEIINNIEIYNVFGYSKPTIKYLKNGIKTIKAAALIGNAYGKYDISDDDIEE